MNGINADDLGPCMSLWTWRSLDCRAVSSQTSGVDIRAYLPSDRDACLAVFDSNMPEFFALSERAEFEKFLGSPGAYFVMEHEDAIVGCGGYAVADDANLASLVWGMVRRDSHRLGLGRFLLMYRLREIGKLEGVQVVRLDTSQRAAGFYEAQAFRVVGVVQDGYGPGLDRVEMVKKLVVCS